METLLAFLNSPNIALLVLIVLVIEWVVLGILWKTRSIGLPPGRLVWFLGSGAAFAFALWVALRGGSPVWMGAALTFAFVCHIVDLRNRWQT